jgi:hypothetical protein
VACSIPMLGSCPTVVKHSPNCSAAHSNVVAAVKFITAHPERRGSNTSGHAQVASTGQARSPDRHLRKARAIATRLWRNHRTNHSTARIASGVQFSCGQGSANRHLGCDSSPRRSCLLQVSGSRPIGLANVALPLLIERATETVQRGRFFASLVKSSGPQPRFT